ncbi:hypothetical protein P692DRAFT_201789508 [Suillus brevipes Sb2]|nr:hypothetical protein P692DRAFT_201789508 [Suillus brevipes Sb2]
MEEGARRFFLMTINSGIPSWVRGSIVLVRTTRLCSIGFKSKLIQASMLTGNAALRHLMQTSNVKYADCGLQQVV